MCSSRIIEEILSSKTPDGYYVIPARKGAKEFLEEMGEAILLWSGGETVIIKVKSRSLAKKIIRILAKNKLLQ